MSNDLQGAAERYADAPTPAHRRAVAIAALPLVRSLARKITLPDHPLATFRDLEHAGMLGMLQALEGYDPSHGTPFASYAFGRIRGSLVDFLRTIDTLSRDRRRRVAHARRAADELSQEIGHDATPPMIAERLGVTVDEVHRLHNDARHRFTLSLHESESSLRNEGAALIDVLPNPEAAERHVDLERQSLYEHVCTLLEHVTEREQRIVQLYYFEDLTLREIAGQLGLTEARISQILSKTLRGLRDQLKATRTAA